MLPLSSHILQALPSFLSYKIPQQLGVWRIPLCRHILDGPLIHGRSEIKDVNSAFSTEYKGRFDNENLCIELQEEKSVLLCHPRADNLPMAWKHRSSKTFYLARAKVCDLTHEDSDYYCIGRLEPPMWVTSLPQAEISAFSAKPFFLCRAIGRHYYIFCNTLSMCPILIPQYLNHTYVINVPNVHPFTVEFKSPSCNLCDGMHEATECLLTEIDSRKHYLESTAEFTEAKRQRVVNPFVTSKDTLLRRTKLAVEIMDRVLDQGVILVSN